LTSSNREKLLIQPARAESSTSASAIPNDQQMPKPVAMPARVAAALPLERRR
jgi:hypothetical protein